MKPKNEKLLAETFELTSYILVEVKLPSDQANSAHDPSLKNEKLHRFSISALILPTKEPIFLTIGSFMYSFLTEEEKIELNNKEHLSLNNKNLKSNVRFFLHYNPKTFRHSTDQGKYIEIQPDYLLFPKDIARSFAEIFQFKTKSPLDPFTSDSDYNINRLISHHAKHFCLLTLRPVSPDSLSSTPKEYQLLNISDHPFEGQSVITISSPFALASSRLYKNTLHVSHISKIAFKTSRKLFGPSRKGCIFLVNNLLKGNDEGSPVFNEHYEVIGLVLGSISPYKNDTISFSVCLASFPIMNLLFKITSYQKGNNVWKLAVSTFRPFIKVSPIKGVLPRVVKIMGGSTTGSGVLLHPKGYILTNRHVLKSDDGQKDFTVEISYDGQADIETYNAETIKISKGDLDIALLRITGLLSDKALKMLRSTQRFVDHSIDVRYLQGHDIYAVGYTFSELQTIDLRVMTTKGYLSKVIVHQNTPFLLLTSCPVYNGFSGGAIISNRGEFLGLTTYNFTHSARGILNDLNFSYCSNIFKELQEAMEEKDEKNLRELDIWSLEDKYIQKMASSQTMEYVPKFEIESKL